MAELSDIPWTGHETPRAIGPIKLVGYSTEWDDRMALVQNRRRAALDVSELVRLLEPVHTLCWGFGVTLTLTDETTATFSAVPNPTGWQGYQVVKLTRMEVPEAGPEDWIEERRAEYDALYDIRDKKNLKAIDGGYVAAYRFEKKKNQGSVKFSLIDAAGHAVGKRLRHKSATATLDDHPNCNGRRPETFHWD